MRYWDELVPGDKSILHYRRLMSTFSFVVYEYDTWKVLPITFQMYTAVQSLQDEELFVWQVL